MLKFYQLQGKQKNPPIPASSNRTVLTVIIMVNLRGGKEPLIKLIAHLIGHERRPTKRARLLIVVHPTVQTRPVKNVLAIRQTPDLVLHLELVQADGATLRRVPGDVAEFDDGEKFLDQEGRRGWVFRQVGSGLRPNDVVGFEKFGETQKVEERENEASDEAEERECVEEEVGEDEDLCVSHWEAHGGALERERERTRVLFLERENADWVYIFEGVL
ncbi:hypothetical protein FF1_000701 [Malus domestica]